MHPDKDISKKGIYIIEPSQKSIAERKKHAKNKSGKHKTLMQFKEYKAAVKTQRRRRRSDG